VNGNFSFNHFAKLLTQASVEKGRKTKRSVFFGNLFEHKTKKLWCFDRTRKNKKAQKVQHCFITSNQNCPLATCTFPSAIYHASLRSLFFSGDGLEQREQNLSN